MIFYRQVVNISFKLKHTRSFDAVNVITASVDRKLRYG